MINKNWFRIIGVLVLSLIAFIYIENININIKEMNKKVSKISKENFIIEKALSRIEEAEYLREYDENKYFKRIDVILEEFEIEMKGIDDSNLNPVSTKDEIIELNKNSISNKNQAITYIRSVVKTRNNLIRLLGIIVICLILLELYLLLVNNSRIKKYLYQMSYRHYDFEVNSGISPFLNIVIKEIDEVRKNLKINDEAIQVLLKGYGINEAILEIYNDESFKKYLKFDRLGLALLKDDLVVANINFSKSKELKLNKGFSIKLSDSKSLTQIKETKQVRIINDLEEHLKENPSSESTRLILEEGFNSSLTTPIISEKNEVIGFLFFSSTSKNNFNKIEEERIKALTKILGYILSKNLLIDDLITSTITSFVKLVEGKDPETANHLERMSLYSKIIAERLSIKSKYSKEIDFFFIENLFKFAPLHDIGKVGIPDKILLKPDKLNFDEFEVMKTHSSIGAKILSESDKHLGHYERNFFKFAKQLVVSHHEKWDGSGYPNSIRGEKIPLVARIISIADVFDALTSKRIYKDAIPFEKSIEIIKEMSGSHFDPDIVNAFLEVKHKLYEVYDELKEI